jgi:type I restriction enzyme R subunit
VINTTEKLFGKQLHQYTIDEAISDGNVLGFHVDYMNTGEFNSHDDLREQLKSFVAVEKPDLNEREIERIVQKWSKAEVERQAYKQKVLQYQDETHIPRVVEEILNNWTSQSQAKEFNALLTVAYKDRVIAYYDEFEKQLKERNEKLNIAMTFSFGRETDPDNIAPSVVKKMFKDYASFTGIEFVAGDKKHGEDAYFEDIIDRTPRGGSGRNPKNIDLVIVADQLLTGYDSKRLNTLYVDRSLELQGLIQAYSRTNRVFGSSKEFGTIVNFQFPCWTEETVDKALELYGSGGKSSRAIVDTYITAVQKLEIAISEMIPTLPDPTEWQTLKDNEEEKEVFILAFRAASEQLNLVEQYYEFKWDEQTFGLDEHTWLKYVGAYKNLIYKPGTPPPPSQITPLVGKTKLAGTQVINAAHILGLIGSKVSTVDGIQTVDTETLRIIHEQIQELSDMGEDKQAQLLKEFVDTELVPGNLSGKTHFDESFGQWKQKQQQLEVEKFAREWGLDSHELLSSVKAYSISEPKVVPYLDDLTQHIDLSKAENQSGGNRLKHIMDLTKLLPDWMAEIKQKFK